MTPEWKPVQNDVVFQFFKEFCLEGDMSMETAGVLQEGRMVWALAKLKEFFEVFKGKDLIESYLLFTNPHQYGWSTVFVVGYSRGVPEHLDPIVG